MAKKSRNEFNWIYEVISTQRELLNGKFDALSELYRMCDSEDQLNLVTSLLKRFDYVDANRYTYLLDQMADYIYNIGYPEKEKAITAITIKKDADSSQEILQHIKVVLGIKFGHRVLDSNLLNEENLSRNYQLGCKHFIAIDEFAGTGSTIVERFNRFKKLNLKHATIEFCIMSGMEDALIHVQNKGIRIKIFNMLRKGISEYYPTEEIPSKLNYMYALERKLAEKIHKIKLEDHSLGFRQSESLYYKFLGNVPNNVFPIFWWKEYAGNKTRKTLFTRVQEGY